jgi:hypothetical protein
MAHTDRHDFGQWVYWQLRTKLRERTKGKIAAKAGLSDATLRDVYAMPVPAEVGQGSASLPQVAEAIGMDYPAMTEAWAASEPAPPIPPDRRGKKSSGVRRLTSEDLATVHAMIAWFRGVQLKGGKLPNTLESGGQLQQQQRPVKTPAGRDVSK